MERLKAEDTAEAYAGAVAELLTANPPAADGCPVAYKDWFDSDACKEACLKRDAARDLLMDAIADRTDDHDIQLLHSEPLDMQREARTTCRRAKRVAEHEILDQAESAGAAKDCRSLYQAARRLQSDSRAGSPAAAMAADGPILTDTGAMLERWREYFDQLLNVDGPAEPLARDGWDQGDDGDPMELPSVIEITNSP